MSISDTGWCFFMLGGIRAVFAPVGTHQPGLCYNGITDRGSERTNPEESERRPVIVKEGKLVREGLLIS